MVEAAVPGRRGGFRKFMWIVLAIFVVGCALWTWFSLSWAYSSGDRAGVLLKFSKKGWICKTYEGQLALYVVGGVAPQLWDFSTRDEAVARQLSAAVGKEVQSGKAELALPGTVAWVREHIHGKRPVLPADDLRCLDDFGPAPRPA